MTLRVVEVLSSQSFALYVFYLLLKQLLDMIAPPYTVEFVQLLLPLIENKAVTDTLRTSDGKDPVSEFISEKPAYLL